MKSTLVCCLLVVAVVAAGVAPGLIAQPQPPVVAEVEPLPQPRIFSPGRIEGASEETELRPRLAGTITELLVFEGQTVEEGDVLLRIDDSTYRKTHQIASAQVQLAEAKLERLVNGAHEKERDEARALVKAAEAKLAGEMDVVRRHARVAATNVVSKQEIEMQKSQARAAAAEVSAAKARLELLEMPTRTDDIRIAQAELQVARAELALAEENLRKTVVLAPIAGTVLDVDCEVGEYATPESSKPLLVMADKRQLRVRAFVEELDAPRVQPGMHAQITVDGLPDQTFAGSVTAVSPRMSKKTFFTQRPDEVRDTRTREVWIDLSDSGPLVLGLRVDVLFEEPTTN